MKGVTMDYSFHAVSGSGGRSLVTLAPSANQLPGSATLQNLVNGLAGWALVAAMAGLVVGAGLWAIGAHAQNYNQTSIGRRAVLASIGAAILIGAAPVLVNFFFKAGVTAH
jgi:hypothetical protein